MKKFLSLLTAIALLGVALVVRVPLVASATISPAHFCIVSLSPSATETLFAIGAGRQVEAVDTDSNYPKVGLPTKRIDPFNPNAEAIASICTITNYHKSTKPDLVVISYDANSIAEKLGLLGVKVVTQGAPNVLADAYAQMIALGKLTGHATAAATIVANLKLIVARDAKSVPLHPKKVLTTYYELDPTLYSLTSHTFVGSMMASLGVTNIADPASTSLDGGYPQLNREYLISSTPKMVLLADTVCCKVTPTNFGQRVAFSTISAVRHHHVYGINDDIASRWGPRLGTLMNDLTFAVKATLADPRVWR